MLATVFFATIALTHGQLSENLSKIFEQFESYRATMLQQWAQNALTRKPVTVKNKKQLQEVISVAISVAFSPDGHYTL